MEYENSESNEERRQAMQKFYEKYDTVRRKYGLTMSAHASFFDDCWIRIWQGKACLASVFLPLLLYLGCCIILEKQREYTWLLLLMADISCCLLSSMGIILACIMLVVLMVMGLVRFRSLEKAACTALCCLPSLILGAIYIVIR